MVVFVVLRGINQVRALVLVAVLAREKLAELVIAHALQHTVTTEIEAVAWLDVGHMYDGGFLPIVQSRLDGTGDDVLLRRGGHLVISDLAHLVEIVHQ